MAEQLSDDSSGNEMDQMEFSDQKEIMFNNNNEEADMFYNGSNYNKTQKEDINQEAIQNQHFDEAMELSSNENSVVTVDDEKENEINPINNEVPRPNNEEQETSPITGQ